MNQSTHSDPEIHALLEDLWQRHLPATRERLDLLENAVRMAFAGQLNATHRAEAQSVAHKLSGNLGMFGHKEAGLIASEIEYILKTLTPDAVAELGENMQRLRHSLNTYL
ncbi:MAG TPA: Hpt domain-containing protein [Edaphobacter sp.]|nr:Hpt domain-containing protein [Edaphobacter sp.]